MALPPLSVQSPEKPIFMHPPAVRTSGETTAQGTNIQQEKTPMDQLTLPQYIIPGGKIETENNSWSFRAEWPLN